MIGGYKMLYVLSVDVDNKTKYFSVDTNGVFSLKDNIFNDDDGFVAIYANKEKANEALEMVVNECREFYLRYDDLAKPIGDAVFNVLSVDFDTKIVNTIEP